MRCSKCGSENRDDAKFCRKCGEALDSQVSWANMPDGVAKKERSLMHKPKAAVIFAILAIVISISSAIVLALKVKNTSADDVVQPSASSALRYSDELYYDAPDESHFAEDVATSINYVDNEMIIYCDDGISIEDALRDGGVEGYKIVGHVAATGSYQVRLHKAMDYSEILDVCNAISSIEGIIKCTPNYTFVAESTEKTGDPAWTEDAEGGKPSKTWGLESIKAPEAWNITRATSDVKVGMFECSQFYMYHEDLDDAIVETLPSSDGQFDIKDGWGWFADEDDHGTHVAGIIGAESNSSGSVGVAYGASLYGYSCAGKDSNGNPKITDGYGIEVGLTYLIVSCDCDVVNISARYAGDVQKRASSGSGADAAAAQWEMQQYAAYYGDFIKALVRGGNDDFIICKSADNDGTKGLANWDMFGCIADDEAASRILIVGSLMQTANGELAVSEHTDPPWASSCGSRVDVLAPGSDIYSTIYSTTDEGDASIPYSDYGYKSGTSMATPMASGVAALVKSANPELKGDQIKEIICATAAGSYVDKTGVSRGQINAEAAVKRAKSVGDDIPRKLVTSFHLTRSGKSQDDNPYEEWVRATYDEAGRITHKEVIREANYFVVEFDTPFSLNYEYDPVGRLVQVSGTEGEAGENAKLLNWDISYAEDGQTSHASETEMGDNRYIDDTFDSDGRLVARNHLVRTGQVLQEGSTTLSYDAYGRIAGQFATTNYGDDQSSANRYEMSVYYDQACRITSIESLDPSGKLLSKYTYEYDDEGRLANRDYIENEGSGNLTVNQTYAYDENGHLSSIEQTGGSGWWQPAKATFETDEDGSIVAATIEGDSYILTYEVEYTTIGTPRGQEPFNAVDFTNPVNPVLYNELFVSCHSGLDSTLFGESEFIKESRRWLELHDPSEVSEMASPEDGGTPQKGTELNTAAAAYLEDCQIVDSNSYQGNQGDSFIDVIGLNQYTRGTKDIEGNSYEHGLEAWIARWNYEEESSWAYSVFDVAQKYSQLSGRVVLIDSYNTEDFDSTLYFYGDDVLLQSYELSPKAIPFDFNVDITGVDKLKIYVSDNKAVSGGTSFGLVECALTR